MKTAENNLVCAADGRRFTSTCAVEKGITAAHRGVL